MIYRLVADKDKFMIFHIENDELSYKMGEDIRIHLGAPPEKYINHWVKPNSTFYKDNDYYPNAIKIPDITIWAKHLILNEKAYKAMYQEILNYGELLPVNCEGVLYYIFNILEVAENKNAIDKENSCFHIMDGFPTDLKSIAFNEDKLKDSLIFKTTFDSYNRVYCTDKFKNLVDENKLTGVIFKMDLEGAI